MTPKVRIVVQARVRSFRLPGKITAPLAGRPLLAHVVSRLRQATFEGAPCELMVATTNDPSDDVTERLCRELDVACFRGSTDDVLGRFADATADLAPNDLVVRATADNPLYCPRRTTAILDEHAVRDADYTCIENLSYVVPEVVRVAALRRLASLARDAYCREHVTPYFRRDGRGFDVAQLPCHWFGLRPEIRLTVDTADELRRMQYIFDTLVAEHGTSAFSLEQVYQLVDRARPSRRLAA